jgi:hypothetical protein
VHLPKDPKCNQYAEVAREREQESGTHLGVFRTARKEVAAYGQCRRSVGRNISIAKPILFYGSPAWNPDTRKKYQELACLERGAIHLRQPPAAAREMMPVRISSCASTPRFKLNVQPR